MRAGHRTLQTSLDSQLSKGSCLTRQKQKAFSWGKQSAKSPDSGRVEREAVGRKNLDALGSPRAQS